MQEIARRAKEDPALREALPDLLGSIEKLMVRLEHEPQKVRLTHPMEGGPIEITLGKFDLQVALASMLRGPELFAYMPDAIARTEKGDWIPLALASLRRRSGEVVRAGLENSQHLISDGAGHSDPLFLFSPQILEVIQAFMRGDKLPTERIDLPPVRFVAPRTVVAMEKPDRYVGTYRINENETRRVLNAGGLLYTQRGRSQPLPIRPTSETDFFYEASATHLRFEMDVNDRVTGMIVFHEGADEGEAAEKIE